VCCCRANCPFPGSSILGRPLADECSPAESGVTDAACAPHSLLMRPLSRYALALVLVCTLGVRAFLLPPVSPLATWPRLSSAPEAEPEAAKAPEASPATPSEPPAVRRNELKTALRDALGERGADAVLACPISLQPLTSRTRLAGPFSAIQYKVCTKFGTKVSANMPHFHPGSDTFEVKRSVLAPLQYTTNDVYTDLVPGDAKKVRTQVL
jgi:hypothetical protein